MPIQRSLALIAGMVTAMLSIESTVLADPSFEWISFTQANPNSFPIDVKLSRDGTTLGLTVFDSGASHSAILIEADGAETLLAESFSSAVHGLSYDGSVAVFDAGSQSRIWRQGIASPLPAPLPG